MQDVLSPLSEIRTRPDFLHNGADTVQQSRHALYVCSMNMIILISKHVSGLQFVPALIHQVDVQWLRASSRLFSSTRITRV